jgi:secreted trypsin-like serine protease
MGLLKVKRESLMLYRILGLSLLLMGLFSCGKREGPLLNGPLLIDSGLIGGDATDAQKIRSIIKFKGGCTGVKVAEKYFLLAAHCLVDSRTAKLKRKLYLKKKKSKLQDSTLKLQLVTIKKAYPHRSYVKVLKKRIKRKQEASGVALEAFDIGLIKIKEETPNISIAKLSSLSVFEGERVIIGGVGCEENTNLPGIGPSERRYKIHHTDIVDLPEGTSDIYRRDISKVEKYNFLTKGVMFEGDQASLCRGDSGGPVYRESTMEVVGINSQYIFTDRSGVSYLNTHTRVSDVFEWIESKI